MHSFPFIIQICVGNEIHCHGFVHVLDTGKPHIQILKQKTYMKHILMFIGVYLFGKPFGLASHSVTMPEI